MTTCLCCGQELPPEEPVILVEKNPDGTTKKWTEITSNGRRVDEYTYYKTGEVNEIVQMVFDEEGTVVCNKKVSHYLDGTNPTVLDNVGAIRGDL